MSVAKPLPAPLRAAAFAFAEFGALMRVGPPLLRGVLMASPFVPALLHGHAGTEDGVFGAVTASLVPALAFAWGRLWARSSEARLRILRSAFLSSPRVAKGAVGTSTTVAVAAAFAVSCAGLALRSHTPLADALALARVGFASAFAWVGLGMALAPATSLLVWLLPIACASARAERGLLYALVPNAQAYALSVDPVSGLEARARFAAMLAVGLGGIGVFAFRRRGSSRRSTPR